MIELVCVDPARAHEFWPHISKYIEASCKRGFLDFGGAKRAALANDGKTFIWIVWDESTDEILAAATTQIHLINGQRKCWIAACGGKKRKLWLHLLDRIEKYARDEECNAVTFMGRNGWQRVLPAFERRGVIMEKSL